MAYRRRRPSTRRAPRRSYRRRSTTVRRIARVARSVMRRQQELKYFDIATTTQGRWDPTVVSLIPITQGDTQSNRDGSQVFLKALTFRGEVVGDSGNPAPTLDCRLVIFRGFGESTTLPIVDNILRAAGIATTTLQPFNFNNNKKYKILYDKRIQVSMQFLDVDPMSGSINIGKYIRLNWKTIYNGSDVTIMDGGLYFFFATDQAVGTDPPVLNCQWRVHFTDS